MPKKRKKTPKQIAKDKANMWFGKYIRRRDADENGYCTCCTCGTEGYWEKDGMQAGHFLDGRGCAILFEETCVHAQCCGCNNSAMVRGQKKDVKIMYFLFMEEKYGREEIDRLMRLKNTEKKYTEKDYLEIAEMYKGKFNNLGLV